MTGHTYLTSNAYFDIQKSIKVKGVFTKSIIGSLKNCLFAYFVCNNILLQIIIIINNKFNIIN